MNDKEIEYILTSKYSIGSYDILVRRLFPYAKMSKKYTPYPELLNTFEDYINNYTKVGSYEMPESSEKQGKKSVIILAIQLKKIGNVENARSMQRGYAKKLIERFSADAALIAFYTEGEPDRWRLSFVSLGYKLTLDNGKLKPETEITPAKRYSFLVGKGEPCHTAIKQLGDFITESEANPEQTTLDDVEKAFSVEKVTDEFFKLYCEKFHKLHELLEQNEGFKKEAESRNFTSVQFAKKLMGQIVFLYFLQKKGWLGVNAWPKTLTEKEYKKVLYSDGMRSYELIPIIYRPAGDGTYRISGTGLENINDADETELANHVNSGKDWGDGPRDFMRRLFNEADKKKINFYDELLEPLFYDALNRNRGERGYCPKFHCRIPFLSGGLFEPIAGYDWESNDFSIPNEFFSNKAEKGKDEADGLLDIFDRYNFTMSEDEPMEREVAIDPEMLGKVFENLLEIKDRKDKGAFYTPREIVHYMCQESLISYLTNTLGISESAIRAFILYGDYMKDADTVDLGKRNGKDSMQISEELYKLNPDGSVAVNRLLDLDEALKNVRVADPAVGSGAFPLGMLNEIVRARQNIYAYLSLNMDLTQKSKKDTEYSSYQLKYETIRNCIFACDLEPSAVDIAQLRLWLALVIDDEVNPKASDATKLQRNPQPLPNLECNILCGNSLIEDFEGVRLIKESDILGSTGQYQRELGSVQFDATIEKLIKEQDDLFECDDTEKKVQHKDKIAKYRDELIRGQLEGCSPDQIQRYKESTKLACKPYVLWQLDFADVFRKKGGFDIVIGNPPYVQLQKEINEKTGEKLGDQYQHCKFATFAKTGDIYCLFFEKGCSLLHENGVLTFITSNKWMRATYGEKLRGFFVNHTDPIRLIDFGSQKVFESATVDVDVLVLTKSKNRGNTLACTIKERLKSNLSVYVDQHSTNNSFSSSESWAILNPLESSIKAKIAKKGFPLSKWNLSVNYGIKTGFNDAFVISTEKKNELIAADPKSAEIIRPILRGRDIKRYGYDFAGLWLINTHNGLKNENLAPINIEKYPAIKAHLDTFYPDLAKRADKGATPYNLRNCAYLDEFYKQKIVYREISDAMDACLVGPDFMLNNKCYLITGEHLVYILSFLNSKLFTKIILSQANTTGGKGEDFLSKISLIEPTPELETKFESLYKQRQEGCNVDDEIEQTFCALYGLTDEETRYIME